jgi:hypothetical protein
MQARTPKRWAGRRIVQFAVTTALLGLLALTSSAQASIVVGKSIAGVALGASEAQVTQALGPPSLPPSPSSNGAVQWNYTKPPLLGVVGLTNGSVSSMWTASRHQRTSKGVGPGSSLKQVRAAYPKAKCSAGPLGPKSMLCTLKSKLGARSVETTFVFFTRSMPAREVDLNFA